MVLPPPFIMKYKLPDGRVIRVVRDDLIREGTKLRYLPVWVRKQKKLGVTALVYASATYGHAQCVIAAACKQEGLTAVILVPKRKEYSEYTRLAREHGAEIMPIANGMLSNCTAKARAIVARSKHAALVPFGARCPEVLDKIAQVARSLELRPKQVWTAISSGTLSCGLQQAWPWAEFRGVCVGHEPSSLQRGRLHKLYRAPEAFNERAKRPPPFPSCPWYDAKVWQFVEQDAINGALFWNVAS